MNTIQVCYDEGRPVTLALSVCSTAHCASSCFLLLASCFIHPTKILRQKNQYLMNYFRQCWLCVNTVVVVAIAIYHISFSLFFSLLSISLCCFFV